MEFDPQDQEIIRLLTRLKDADVAYPQDMLAARRGKYLKQMAEGELGRGTDTGINDTTKDVSTPHLSPTASTLLEVALVVAIIAETGAIAYFYREKVANFFRTVTTTWEVHEVSTQMVVPTTLEIQGVTPSPAVTPTLPSATMAASPTETAIILTNTQVPALEEENSSTTAAANQMNSTPAPNVGNGSNGNNGNHYGQTPRPERTKENNGNNENNSNRNQSDTNNQNSNR
jgi:hypothetical protein